MRDRSTGELDGSVPPPTVLIVEPDDDTRDRLVAWLREAGFLVRDVQNFAAARRVLADDGVPRLIVSELRLGSYNGLHLALVARRSAPATRTLILAGGHDSTLAEEARRCGAEYIVKPLERTELLAHVSELLHTGG